jgi:hypothetical protein
MAGTGKTGAVSVLLAVALAVAPLALVATRPAEAVGRYKTVTKTFSNTSSISIPRHRPGLTLPFGDQGERP